jgi:hypothetical protein
MPKKRKLGYWNYRIMETSMPDNTGREAMIYSVIEVYYDTNDKIMGYVEKAYPYGETARELKLDLSAMLKGCRKPVLTYDELNPKKRKSKKKK